MGRSTRWWCCCCGTLNRGASAANITAEWTDIGLNKDHEATVRDLWKMSDVGSMKGSVTAMVASHGVVMYKITSI